MARWISQCDKSIPRRRSRRTAKVSASSRTIELIIAEAEYCCIEAVRAMLRNDSKMGGFGLTYFWYASIQFEAIASCAVLRSSGVEPTFRI